MIDGVDAAQLDPGWLRRQIGVVLQENLLFNRTIHENIALGDPAMPRAMVMHAAELAGADEFIAQLPQGYDTMIEERGANLSGGQRQRIAIARALADQSAHPHPRRGDVGARLRERADHSGQHARDRARAHGHHHRPSPGGGAPLHPDRRHAAEARSSRSARTKSCSRAKDGLYARLWALQSEPSEGASMNERAAPPAATPPQPPSRHAAPSSTGRDREFLPAALEILETPPPPLPIALIGDDLRLARWRRWSGRFWPAGRPCDGAGQDRDGRLRQGDRAA